MNNVLTKQIWGNNIGANPGPKSDFLGNMVGSQSKVLTQTEVRTLEPRGTKAPKYVQERASGWAQMMNLSHDFDLSEIQAAFRAAEYGDTLRCFSYYRDFFTNDSAVMSALNKRKLSVLADQWNIMPVDKNNEDDVLAAKVMLSELKNFTGFHEALIHLLNAVVFPVTALDKTFDIYRKKYNPFGLRYTIKKLYPIPFEIMNWRVAYLPNGNTLGLGLPPNPLENINEIKNKADDLNNDAYNLSFNPDSWEPNLRFYSVLDNGLINYNLAYMYEPDPNKHIIYRSNLSNGIARENYAGLGKSLLFLSIMSQMGKDIFLRCLQRYGMPIAVAKVDTSQVDVVNQIMDAFGNLNVLNAIAVNKDAEIELKEINYSGAAEAHSKYLQFINNQINLLLLGQTLDSSEHTGGMGNGKDSIQSDVRDDIKQFDRNSLSNCLRNQLFRQFLDINGYSGECYITFGGGNSDEKNKMVADTLVSLHTSGFEPTNESVEVISEKLGYNIQKIGMADNSVNIESSKTDETDTNKE